MAHAAAEPATMIKKSPVAPKPPLNKVPPAPNQIATPGQRAHSMTLAVGVPRAERTKKYIAETNSKQGTKINAN